MIFEALSKVASDTSSIVVRQMHFSLKRNHSKRSKELSKLLASSQAKNNKLKSLQAKQNTLPKHLNKYSAGHKTYQAFCIACHGTDKGLTRDGKLMAPKFTDNKRVKNQQYFAKVILKGLHGPLGSQKETFSEAIMPPLGAVYNDQQIADVMNYIGRRWAQSKQDISAKKIAAIRKNTRSRVTPWTYRDLIKSLRKRTRGKK